MKRFVCIHGHFYQPPREHPWLEEVELQDGAYPYHDWNERITAECYAPNAASRILDHDRAIIDIVNNYAKISFNFGPTLMSWLAKRSPATYKAILAADRKSREQFDGHGAAIAQCYNHMIMPLANARDKRTQVVWGIADFEHRFKRRPEGMWLPETAVDLETLELLVEHGITFTILAPGQARRVRRMGEETWHDVNGSRVDPKRPYRCSLPSGKSIAIFFYDGPISQQVAFAGVLNNGEGFAKKLTGAFVADDGDAQLVHIATDGETYGHHHRFGDMALAYCLYYLREKNLAELAIYGAYLAKTTLTYEVEIHENSSWSCAHGVERWRSDCGCSSGMHAGWHQKWRAPLRGALDWLRDNVAGIFEEEAGRLLKDPWAARDAYISCVLDRSPGAVDQFLAAHRRKDLTREEESKVLQLLEMERSAMLMFTSCGWFFDEVSGIETVQIMMYAARAIQLAEKAGTVSLEEAFINLLTRVPSNLPRFGTAAKVYDTYVKPAVLDLLRVGVHYAVSSLFTPHADTARIHSYGIETKAFEMLEMGKQKLVIGRVIVRSLITREEDEVSFCVLYLGDYNLIAAAREFMGDEAFADMHRDLKEHFYSCNIAEMSRLIENHFNNQSYSLWHLFRDDQRKVLGKIFEAASREINNSFRQIFEHHASIIQLTDTFRMPLLRPFAAVADQVLNLDIREALEADPVEVQKLKKAITEITHLSLAIDKPTLGFIADGKVSAVMDKLLKDPEDIGRLANVVELLETLGHLSLDLNLWRAQNAYFSLGKKIGGRMRDRAEGGEAAAATWMEKFNRLGEHLQVRFP